MAHVTGMGSGLVLGALAGAVRLPERLGPRAQTVAGIAAAGLVLMGWVVALSR